MKRQGIGYHIEKYLAQKAAKAAAADTAPSAEAVGPEAPEASEEESEDVRDTDTSQPEQPTMAAALAMIAELLKEIRSTDNVEAKERAAMEAERMLLERERLSREMPENKQHPAISVYSYPEGDKARPKPALRCKTYWCGHELQVETLTPEEIETVNRLQPGVYRVLKADGSPIKFTVNADYSDAFDPETDRPRLEAVRVSFPFKGDQRQNHGSMLSYCLQALGDRIPSQDELMAEVIRLKAEVATAKAGLVGAV